MPPQPLIPPHDGDPALMLRSLVTPYIHIPYPLIDFDKFDEFAVEKNISLTGVEKEDVSGELLKRVRLLRGELLEEDKEIWPPLRSPVNLKEKHYSPSYIALFALTLYCYPNDMHLAEALIYCISKNSKEKIRNLLLQIQRGQYPSK